MERRGEEVGVASLLNAAFLADFRDGQREVADGDVRFGERLAQGFESFAGKVERAFHPEGSSGEIGRGFLRGVQMAVPFQFGQSVAAGDGFEGPAFQDGGVRLVEVSSDFCRRGGGCRLFFLLGEIESLFAAGDEVRGEYRGWGVVSFFFQDEQKFLAFVFHGEDVDFPGFGKKPQGFGQVGHGGDFDDDPAGFF